MPASNSDDTTEQHPGGPLPQLTPREQAVIELLSAGHGKRQIAERLRVGERTVDRVVATIAEKFSALDPNITAGIGYVGRTARVIALYAERVRDGRRDAPQPAPEPFDLGTPPLVRLAVRSELAIDEQQVRNDTQLTVRCLHDEVPHSTHGMMLDDRDPEASVMPRQLEVWSYAPRVGVSHTMLIVDHKRPLFQVQFDPPLTRGQELTYHYAVTTPGYIPLSQAAIAARIAAGYYPLDELLCEKTYSIGTPTGHLTLRLTFPPLFELEGEHVVVEVGRGGPRDAAEEQRIRETGALAVSRFARRVSLTLDLPRPVLLRRYKLRWRPAV